METNGAVIGRGQCHRLVINGYGVMIKLTNGELQELNDTFYSSFETMH